ncbi:MAG: 1-deoxy-D-xylulose-5-phosphate reductoisomerase [Solibacterales bacterium]|nr:1-deoxy-D-xylulose-5-phosphate reductoisomerase [Bryobacterales bacterium]|tara:strand:+ start:8887 stop:10080 length:1194 start_codon:yes stop_codon:yes gene_type:complete
MKRISILGSTGSVGRNTLQVVREMREECDVVALAAGSNVEELVHQTVVFQPELVSLANQTLRDEFLKKLTARSDWNGSTPEALYGSEGNLAAVSIGDLDIVVSATVGVKGLEATFDAVKRGKRVALANKEVLVAAGALVMTTARDSGAELLPVDSEHNGVHQCLHSGSSEEVSRLILTASGGPFRTLPKSEFNAITPRQALNHPTWKMGPRITIDSSTLMNKGFEVIEARWLFDFLPEQIEIVVHPQSIVHALLEFQDGSVVAQLSPPDMKLPIRYALSYPRRQPGPQDRRLQWDCVRQLDFEPPDRERFPLLELAYEALRIGGAAGCVLNAADEVAVEAFLDDKIGFSDLPRVVSDVMDNVGLRQANSPREVLDLDREVRRVAWDYVQRRPKMFTV